MTRVLDGDLADVMEGMGSAAGAAGNPVAYLRFATGDIDRAVAAFELVRIDELREDSTSGVVLALWAEIATDAGTDEQRRWLAGALETFAGLHLVTGGIYCGAAARVRALLLDRLGEHERADELFAEAVRQHEDLRTPTWIARTPLDWAEALLRRGSPDTARTHLDAAASALGNLDLPDNQLRLTELRAQLPA